MVYQSSDKACIYGHSQPKNEPNCLYLAEGSGGMIVWDSGMGKCSFSSRLALHRLRINTIDFILNCSSEEPIEVLSEPCAINSFDIDRNNPLVLWDWCEELRIRQCRTVQLGLEMFPQDSRFDFCAAA